MFSYSQTVDPITVINEMRVRGTYRENETERYVREVMQATPTAANVLEYCAIVRDKSLLRSLGDVAEEVTGMVYEGAGDADALLEMAERKNYA